MILRLNLQGFVVAISLKKDQHKCKVPEFNEVDIKVMTIESTPEGVEDICMDFVLLSEKNFMDVIGLFDEKFYFLTTYPQIISLEELKIFLLKTGQTYKIVDGEKTIGLAYYRLFNEEYVFMKLKTKKEMVDDIKSISLLKQFLKLIKRDVKHVKRIETMVYEFDNNEINMLNKAGFRCEVEKRKEVFKEGRFWSALVYTLVDDEIKHLIES